MASDTYLSWLLKKLGKGAASPVTTGLQVALSPTPTSSEDTLPTGFTTGRAGSKYTIDSSKPTSTQRLKKYLDDRPDSRQPPSQKTIYLDEKNKKLALELVNSIDMDLTFKPPSDATKRISEIILNKNYGPRKKGSSLGKINFSMVPQKGLYPLEIYGAGRLPKGQIGPFISSSGSTEGIHLGSMIKDLLYKKRSGGAIERNLYNYEPRAI